MIYHSLSVKQPWASLIASGQKTIETRTWETKYRGDLLICSSKKSATNDEIMLCGRGLVSYFDSEGQFRLFNKNKKCPFFPEGTALAVARLKDCRLFNRETDMDKSRVKSLYRILAKGVVRELKPIYAWILTDIRSINPFPVKGKLGIFTVEMP